jgi:hypothetical protein
MRRHFVLGVILAALAAVNLACGGSPAAPPPVSASPSVTPPAKAAPTNAAPPYPVVTPAGASAQQTAAPSPAATAAPIAPPATGTPAPPYPVLMDGLALMTERCTVCHDLARIQSAKKSRADWESTVAKYRAKGAKLTDAETAVLVDFLAASYK